MVLQRGGEEGKEKLRDGEMPEMLGDVDVQLEFEDGGSARWVTLS